MESLLLYILKSTVCLTLFYVSFKALFSNDTFFRFNRWVLLAGTGICMLLPLARIETKEALLIQRPIMHLEKIISEKESQTVTQTSDLPETIISAPDSFAQHISWDTLLWIFYIAGSVVFLASTLSSFYKMFKIIRKGRMLNRNDHTIVLLPKPVSPFSWGPYIILSEEDYYSHPDEILTHEKMHLRHHHTIDLFYMEILMLLHWFNPAVWLLKRELKEIHEYQADKGVLNQGIDATKYQLLLVKKAVGSSHYTIANSFNHSKIKKRITMMLKEKSNSWARLKLLLLVPVGLIALSAFASPVMNIAPVPKSDSVQIPTDKSTVNEQAKQQDYVVFLTYDESDRESKICMPCKTIEEIKRRIKNGQFKDAKEVTINPVKEGITMAFLEEVKDILESENMVCKIDPTIPEAIKARNRTIAQQKKETIYLIQDKQIKCVINGEPDPSLFEKISKSTPVVIQPGSEKVSMAEMQKVKELLEERGFEGKIKTEVFKTGDALPPPPPPMPKGLVKITYKDGSNNKFFIDERDASSSKGIEDQIKTIYSDSIDIVQIHIEKSAPKGLLEMVKKALEKEIPYKVNTQTKL